MAGSAVTCNAMIYSGRLPESCIRILKLYSGDRSDDIHCDLEEVSLGKAPSFHALSYCWGTSGPESTIFCNSQPFRVTRNLYSALKQLCLVSQLCYLWVDAICINQDSSLEKASQVSIMAQIFEYATRVVVWLGEDDKTTNLALAAMRQIWASFCLNHASISQDQEQFETLGHDERVWQLLRADIAEVVVPNWQDDTKKGSDALRTFFSNPWFSRIWVIQEVRSCSDILVQIGTQTIPWNLVALAAAWVVYAPSSVTHIDEPYKFGGFLHTDLMRQRIQCTKDDVPFLEVLDRCRSFQSTIDMDRIFALLQHPVERIHDDADEANSVNTSTPSKGWSDSQPSSHFNIKVSYDVKLPQLYRQIVLGSIAEGRSLQVLSHAMEDPKYRSGYPTWMPVWHGRSSRFAGPRRTFLYNASKGRLPKVLTFADPALLGLHGILCGEVSAASINIGLSKDSSPSMDSKGIQYGTSPQDLWEFSRLIVRDCWQPAHNWVQHSMRRVSSQSALHFQDFSAFMGERIKQSTGLLLVSLHGKWCNICWQRHVVSSAANNEQELQILHCEICFDFDICLSCYRDGNRCPGNHKPSPRTIPAALCQVDDETRAYLTTQGEQGVSHRFDLSVRQAFDQQTFFRLDNGRLGIGPDALRPGDVVVVFFGGRVPFVLRQQHDRYSIVGECYVHGLMDGVAIDEACERQTNEKCFVLV